MSLLCSIYSLLACAGAGRSAREIARELRVTRPEVNRDLYRFPTHFRSEGTSPPQWFITSIAPSESNIQLPPLQQYALELYKWQTEAMAAWKANACCGIVEAVTGAGKTRLGLVAVKQTVNEGGYAAVLVPTIELLHQWRGQLENLGVKVGLMGDGNRDTLGSFRVIVATADSARQNWLSLPQGASGLLVADEVHRFAAPQNRLGLKEGFDKRLGLSATYERQDGLHKEALLPYFEKVVFTLDYKRATKEEVIAEVRVAMFGVDLLPDEQEAYNEYSAAVSKMSGRLINKFGVPANPYSAFIERVNHMAESGSREEGIAAKRYLKAVGERRKLLAETPRKIWALEQLTPSIKAADRTILFTTTIEGADKISEMLKSYGICAESHHSGIPSDERRRRLEAFGNGSLKAITTAQTLNEGVDVPAADLGLIFGGSRQRREMVQRLGRVLRRKDDDRDARFVILYVRDSSEDPRNGYQEVFIQEMLEIAKEVKLFTLGDNINEMTYFLNP